MRISEVRWDGMRREARRTLQGVVATTLRVETFGLMSIVDVLAWGERLLMLLAIFLTTVLCNVLDTYLEVQKQHRPGNRHIYADRRVEREKRKHKDALQVVVFCVPHIAFIAHLHVLAEEHRSFEVAWGCACSLEESGWKRVLFGDADKRLETKNSTYIVSSRVGRSSLTIQDIVIQSDIVPVDHHIQGRQEWWVPRERQTRREPQAI